MIRHSSLRAAILTTRSCSRQYCRHNAARRQHGIHQLGRQRIFRHSGAHRLIEGPSPDLAQADAERVQRMANGVLQIEELGLQIAATRQQKLRPIAALRLDIGLAEPAGTHDMGDAECICFVGFVALPRQRGAHVLRLQADDRQIEFLEFWMQPGTVIRPHGRRGAGAAETVKHRKQRIGICHCRRLEKRSRIAPPASSSELSFFPFAAPCAPLEERVLRDYFIRWTWQIQSRAAASQPSM